MYTAYYEPDKHPDFPWRVRIDTTNIELVGIQSLERVLKRKMGVSQIPVQIDRAGFMRYIDDQKASVKGRLVTWVNKGRS